jgi:transcriptional regulator with XRE-family HTH domain
MSDAARRPADATVGLRPGGAGDGARAVVAGLVLGKRLRRLRDAAGLGVAEAAEAAGVLVARVEGLEQGSAGIRLRDVASLYDVYGVSDVADRATLLGLARQATMRPWWHDYLDVIPAWFEHYLAWEQAASLIRCFAPQVLPVLLQTSDYARAVVARSGAGAGRADVQRRVDLRMARQQVLNDVRPPRLWVVIDEAALRRPAGSRAVMRAQLRHLIGLCDLPHVTIAVLPFRAGGHPAVGGPLAVLRLPDRQLPDIAYLEQLASGLYFRNVGHLDYYRHVLNQLALLAEEAGPPQQALAGILRET